MSKHVLSKWVVASYDLVMNIWLLVPSSLGSYKSLIDTNFCSIGPNKSRPGFISECGSLVSTVVLTIAKNQPFDEILCVYDTQHT